MSPRLEIASHALGPHARRDAAVVLAVAACTVAAVRGTTDVATGTLAVTALVLVAAGLMAGAPRAIGAYELVGLAALAALALWTAASASWSLTPDQSIREADRTLLYVAALGGGIAAVRVAGVAAAVVGVAAGCALVSGAVLARGVDAVGYAGAAGAVAAIGATITVGGALEGRRLALLACPLFGAALVTSANRAAVLAVVAGVAVQAALAAGRRRALVAGALAGALLVPAALAWGTSWHGRGDLWATALGIAADHEVHGIGAGAFQRAWAHEHPGASGIRDAHDLVLETAAELGAVGVALLAVALGTPLAAAARARAGAAVRCAAGAFAAFLVHAGLHWDWEMPVVVVPALLLGGALLAAGAAGHRHLAIGPWARAGALAAVALCTVAAGSHLVAATALEHSRTAAALGAPAAGEASARTAARWAPWAAEPWRRLAEAALARGDRRLALQRVRRALARDDGDRRSWALLARLEPARRG